MPCSRLLLLLALVAPSAVASDDWPQFRGPGGQGHSRAAGLPLRWSEAENLTWKVAVGGSGWSSPVVLQNQIWITTAVETAATPQQRKQRLAADAAKRAAVPELFGGESKSEFGDWIWSVATSVSLRAVCLQRETGGLLHNVELFHVDQPQAIHSLNSYASPTPVAEPGRVYCDFGAFGTGCLDSATGRILWKRSLVVDHQVGPGSSPILYKDLLILVRDGYDQQYVAALDKQTGKTVWKTDRPLIDTNDGSLKKAFSTALVVETDGLKQLVVPGARWVVAYEPATGKPIWRAHYDRGYSTVPRPVFGHGMVYICTGYNVPQLWAIRAGGHGDVTDTHVVWKAKRQIPKKSSPLLVDGQLYVVSDSGVSTCFDARTGEVHWRKRIRGNYSASPVYADRRIYFFSQEGKATVLRPGTQFVKLAENHVRGRLMAFPAVAGKAIFLRTDTRLYRIEKR